MKRLAQSLMVGVLILLPVKGVQVGTHRVSKKSEEEQ